MVKCNKKLLLHYKIKFFPILLDFYNLSFTYLARFDNIVIIYLKKQKQQQILIKMFKVNNKTSTT